MATALGSYATAALIKERAGITDSTDDTLLGKIADQVNMYIERETQRVLAPISGTPVLTYDGDGSNRLYLPVTQDEDYPFIGGIRAITTLEIADYTNGAYSTIVSTDYFLRGKSQPGAPFDWLYLSDLPTGSYARFPRGYGTVRITATCGWAAIPDDIIDVALTVAVRLWHARETGQQDIVGTDEMGERLVSRFLSARDRDTIRAYTLGRNRA
jgi:hypothetical protein